MLSYAEREGGGLERVTPVVGPCFVIGRDDPPVTADGKTGVEKFDLGITLMSVLIVAICCISTSRTRTRLMTLAGRESRPSSCNA